MEYRLSAIATVDMAGINDNDNDKYRHHHLACSIKKEELSIIPLKENQFIENQMILNLFGA